MGARVDAVKSGLTGRPRPPSGERGISSAGRNSSRLTGKSAVEHDVGEPPELVKENSVGRKIKIHHSSSSSSKKSSSSRGINIFGGETEVGLENLGNTCFMNCSLQCILHIKPLVSHFLNTDISEQINMKSPVKGVLATSFASLCKEIATASTAGASSSSVSIAPTKFKKAVSVYAPHLLDYQQQDSQEFLRFLLDGMAEDLCRQQRVEVEIENIEPQPPQQSTNNNNNNNNNNQEEVSSPKEKTVVPLRQKLQKQIAQAQQLEIEVEGLDDAASGLHNIENLEGLSISGAPINAPNYKGAAPLSNSSSCAATIGSPGCRPLGIDGGENEWGELDQIDGTATSTEKLNRSGKKKKNPQSWEGINPEPVGTVPSYIEPVKGLEPEPEKTIPEQSQEAWKRYLKFNDSVITDIFGGQLQSTIECQTCKATSCSFDPFLDLSVPIPRGESKSLLQKTLNFTDSGKCTLEKCLEKFTAEETLEDMVDCEKCKQKRKCIKKLSIYRRPKVLLVHIKRFQFNINASRASREKVSTEVQFPMKGLDINPFMSTESDKPEQENATYDLVGVTNHSGSIHGGHYIAHVDINNAIEKSIEGKSKWMCFNDERVSKPKKEEAITGSSAYVLFYQLRDL